MRKIFPPANLGVLGSGQLGRMFTNSASRLGYNVICYSPVKDSPTKLAGAIEIVGEYTDKKKLTEFLNSISALTFEFENIPEDTLHFLEEFLKFKDLKISPSPYSIRTANDRIREKTFFEKIGIPVTNYIPIIGYSPDLKEIETIKFPAILKTNNFGYDGKGQTKFITKDEFIYSLDHNKNYNHILEEIVNFDCEISVIGCRFENKKTLLYPPSKNIHKNHILDLTIHPSGISGKAIDKALNYTRNLLQELDYVGVLGVEFFVKGNEILGNEFAPRPHNSGHFTLDGANFSQFDLQLFTLTGLIDDINLETVPTVMKNIVGGDFFKDKLNYYKYLHDPKFKIHIYQKKDILPGRKLGHINYRGIYSDSLYSF